MSKTDPVKVSAQPAKPNSGLVKAKATIPECKVLKRLEDQGEDGILKTIENVTVDAECPKNVGTYF